MDCPALAQLSLNIGTKKTNINTEEKTNFHQQTTKVTCANVGDIAITKLITFQ